MNPIKDGQKLPPFPFKVICIDNSGREEEIVKGKTYTAKNDAGWGNGIAGPDLILDGIHNTFSIRRFSIITGPPDLSDWRVWRDHGLQPGECACKMPKKECWIHR